MLVAISAQCRSFGLKSSCMGSGGDWSGAGGERRERRAPAGAEGVRASGACATVAGKLSLEYGKPYYRSELNSCINKQNLKNRKLYLLHLKKYYYFFFGNFKE